MPSADDKTMAQSRFLCLLLMVFINVMALVSGCSQPMGWRSKDMQELLASAGTVLYGKDLEHFNSTVLVPGMDGMEPRVDVKFQVYCVLEGNNSLIPTDVILEYIWPPLPCGTDADMTVGKEYIVMVKQINGTHFGFDAGNLQHASFEADRMATAMEVCDLQEPKAPIDALERYKDTCNSLINSYVNKNAPCISGARNAQSVLSHMLFIMMVFIQF